MRAGRLDRLITIQRKTVTVSNAGEPVESWTTIETRRPAAARPAGGSERFSTPTTAAEHMVEFRIRWSENVADLSALDRIVYPALAAPGEEPVARNIYDVLAVEELGRREGLRVVTKRRPDVTA